VLLQRAWQTAYNRLFSVSQIFVCIYVHAYNRIRVAKAHVARGLTVSPERQLNFPDVCNSVCVQLQTAELNDVSIYHLVENLIHLIFKLPGDAYQLRKNNAYCVIGT
jgi:hypothetical protein